MAERIETFIGFCVKTRRITLGAGAVDCLRDKVYLLILSADAAKNTKKSAIKFKNRFSCPLLICKSAFAPLAALLLTGDQHGRTANVRLILGGLHLFADGIAMHAIAVKRLCVKGVNNFAALLHTQPEVIVLNAVHIRIV